MSQAPHDAAIGYGFALSLSAGTICSGVSRLRDSGASRAKRGIIRAGGVTSGPLAEPQRQLGLNSGNSGKPPSSNGLKKKPARTASPRGRSGKKPGGQPGHPGRTPRRTENSDATIDRFPKTCSGCGSVLAEATATSHIARQVADLPEPRPPPGTEHRPSRNTARMPAFAGNAAPRRARPSPKT